MYIHKIIMFHMTSIIVYYDVTSLFKVTDVICARFSLLTGTDLPTDWNFQSVGNGTRKGQMDSNRASLVTITEFFCVITIETHHQLCVG